MAKSSKAGQTSEILKGWKAIGSYLGIGTAAAQRWAKNGMPVRREGRFTVADTDEIRRWLGREAHMAAPAFVAPAGEEIAAALKQSLAAVKRQKR